jgi:hypothetical protein
MRELSVAEQRYQAVLAVISDGLSICQVVAQLNEGSKRAGRSRRKVGDLLIAVNV